MTAAEFYRRDLYIAAVTRGEDSRPLLDEYDTGIEACARLEGYLSARALYEDALDDPDLCPNATRLPADEWYALLDEFEFFKMDRDPRY